MEFLYGETGNVPESIISLSRALDKAGVGRFGWRSDFVSEASVLPSVYISCNASNGIFSCSTSLYDMLSELADGVYVDTYQSDAYSDLRYVTGGRIISKYVRDFGSMTICVYGGTIVAICDMDKREIFLPDYTHDHRWTEYADRYIKQVVDMVRDLKSKMETFQTDRLCNDMEMAKNANTSVEVTKINLKATFDKDGFVRDCMEAVRTYEEMTDRRYRVVFRRLKNKADVAQGAQLGDAIELINRMKKNGFSFVTSDVLKYTGGKITANHGLFAGAVYNTLEEMWISGLKLLVNNGKIVGARYHRAHHPNCASSDHTVCIGDMAGIPIDDAWKVVEAMKLPNFGGGYWENPLAYLGEKVSDLCGEEEMLWRNDTDDE